MNNLSSKIAREIEIFIQLPVWREVGKQVPRNCVNKQELNAKWAQERKGRQAVRELTERKGAFLFRQPHGNIVKKTPIRKFDRFTEIDKRN